MSFSWIHPPILELALSLYPRGVWCQRRRCIKPHIWCLVAIWGRGRAESGGLFRRENFGAPALYGEAEGVRLRCSRTKVSRADSLAKTLTSPLSMCSTVPLRPSLASGSSGSPGIHTRNTKVTMPRIMAGHPYGSLSPKTAESDGPALLAVAHIPEHPLVATGGDETLLDAPLGRRVQFVADPVRHGEDGPHDLGKVLAPIGVDPSPVERVGGAAF